MPSSDSPRVKKLSQKIKDLNNYCLTLQQQISKLQEYTYITATIMTVLEKKGVFTNEEVNHQNNILQEQIQEQIQGYNKNINKPGTEQPEIQSEGSAPIANVDGPGNAGVSDDQSSRSPEND